MEVFSTNATIDAVVVKSTLRDEIDAGDELRLSRVEINALRPDVLSLPLVRTAIKTQSFIFGAPSAAVSKSERETDCGTSASPGLRDPSPLVPRPPPRAPHPAPLAPRTRLKPPGDIVKLADRLHYVLQPSLETLLADSSLDFPFVPFPYQLAGAAFLFPRVGAVLADEMGLGKTMQAITAIRLLIRSGEIRSVLLVCPKPLVSNWQR
ncbi:MAG TPA: SNF2-related protein, partial [Pirellulales bacterium]|nr:SNF2-related protein [Pirellulales bacterium]